MRLTTLVVGAVAILIQGVAPAAVHAQVNEAELKAAFVFNFVAFVAWPAGDGGDLLVCMRAGSDLEGALTRLNRKRIGPRRIVTRLLKSPEDAGPCQVIVADIGAAVDTATARADGTVQARAARTDAERGAWPDGWWRRNGVLSIADGGDAERNGAVITFVRENARVGFDVDGVAAEQSGLDLSSKLLRLARRVL